MILNQFLLKFQHTHKTCAQHWQHYIISICVYVGQNIECCGLERRLLAQCVSGRILMCLINSALLRTLCRGMSPHLSWNASWGQNRSWKRAKTSSAAPPTSSSPEPKGTTAGLGRGVKLGDTICRKRRHFCFQSGDASVVVSASAPLHLSSEPVRSDLILPRVKVTSGVEDRGPGPGWRIQLQRC